MEPLVQNHKLDIVNTSDIETKCNTLFLYTAHTLKQQIKQMHKAIITE